jgi:segregation and condensation protein A
VRSALASTFTAGLELAKQGKIELKQDGLFRPIYLRAMEHGVDNGMGDDSADATADAPEGETV